MRRLTIFLIGLAALVGAILLLNRLGRSAPPQFKLESVLGQGSFNDAVWSPDGRTIAIASTIGVVVYGAFDLAAKPTILPVAGGVQKILYSPKGNLLASIGHDLRIWDATTLKEKLVIYERDPKDTPITDGKYPQNVIFRPDEQYLAIEGYDIVSLWSLSSGSQINEWKGSGPIIFTPNNRAFIFTERDTNGDNILRVWDIPSANAKLSIPIDYSPNFYALSPDGQTLVWASGDPYDKGNLLHLVSMDDGKELSRQKIAPLLYYTGYILPLKNLVFNPTGDLLAAASDNGFTVSVELSGIPVGKPDIFLDGKLPSLTNMAFSPDGKFFITAEGTNYETPESHLTAWNVDSGEVIIVSQPFARGVRYLHFSPDSSEMITVHDDGVVRIWMAEDLKLMSTLGQGVVDSKLTPDGKTLALVNSNGDLRIWTVDMVQRSLKETVYRQIAPSFADIPIAINPSGTMLAYVENNRCPIQIWDVQTNVTHSTCPDFNGYVTALTFSPDGKMLAASIGIHTPLSRDDSDRPQIYLWEVGQWQQPVSPAFSGSSMWVNTLAFNSNSSWLAAGGCHSLDAEAKCSQGEILIWDTQTGQLVKEPVYEHSSDVTAFAFQPDSSILVSGSGKGNRFSSSGDDYSVVVWNIAAGSHHSSSFRNGEIFSLVFGTHTHLLAIGTGENKISPDSEVRVWDFVNDPIILDDNNAPIKSIAFTGNDRELIAASDDGTLRIWSLLADAR